MEVSCQVGSCWLRLGMMLEARVKLPPKLIPVFVPGRGAFRWRVLYGGRGSGKSFTVAQMAAIWGAMEPIRILCTREFQASIRESMHAEIKGAIEATPWLAAQYEIGRDYIRGKNGTAFIFRGLRHNISAIKSLAKIDLCIIEEAEDISAASWQELIPTIRAPRSELWVIFNPKRRNSWVAEQFVTGTPPPRSKIIKINHDDNPCFPTELDEQRRHDMATADPALYRHVWEGEFYEQSDAQVFAGRWRMAEFEPGRDWDGPYIGLDFGFAQDETAAIRAWIYEGRLYLDRELYQKRLELDDTVAAMTEAIPDAAKHAIRADSARPESISYLTRHGLPGVVACKKGAGSVEDGIGFIKSFSEIVIHPRCRNAIKEFELYSYKVDRLSGDILPTLIDANNHLIDALRYALEPIMRNRSGVGLMVPKRLRRAR